MCLYSTQEHSNVQLTNVCKALMIDDGGDQHDIHLHKWKAYIHALNCNAYMRPITIHTQITLNFWTICNDA